MQKLDQSLLIKITGNGCHIADIKERKKMREKSRDSPTSIIYDRPSFWIIYEEGKLSGCSLKIPWSTVISFLRLLKYRASVVKCL